MGVPVQIDLNEDEVAFVEELRHAQEIPPTRRAVVRMLFERGMKAHAERKNKTSR